MNKVILFLTLLLGSSVFIPFTIHGGENSKQKSNTDRKTDDTEVTYPVEDKVRTRLIKTVREKLPELIEQAEAFYKDFYPKGPKKDIIMKDLITAPNEPYWSKNEKNPKHYRVFIGTFGKRGEITNKTLPNASTVATPSIVYITEDGKDILMEGKEGKCISVEEWKKAYQNGSGKTDYYDKKKVDEINKKVTYSPEWVD